MHLRLSIAAFAAMSLCLSASSASADEVSDTKVACVSALDDAQSQKSSRRLRDARASFVACSSEACPGVVREDCARSLLELDQNIPSVVLSATVDGQDAIDARVLLDGTLAPFALDGRALVLDPGAHLARFERAGSAPVEVRFVAREGEKNRTVSAAFVLPRSVPSASPQLIKQEGRGWPVLPVVLGGVGLAAIGGGVFMRMSAATDADRLQSSCAPTCDSSERSALSDRLVISNVALGVGAVALTASAITWLIARK
jgi:hypothetical protein